MREVGIHRLVILDPPVDNSRAQISNSVAFVGNSDALVGNSDQLVNCKLCAVHNWYGINGNLTHYNMELRLSALIFLLLLLSF